MRCERVLPLLAAAWQRRGRGSSWGIRREELFSSTLLDAASLPHLDEAQFRFVWWTERPYLLLTQQLPPNLKLAAPHADVDPATSELRVVEAVAADSVPEAQRGAATGSYDLFAADGKRCTAKAAPPVSATTPVSL